MPDETAAGPVIVASCGQGLLPGQVWRPGDGLKHLGPPSSLSIHPWSRLFSTRCGLDSTTGRWQASTDDDDAWCPGCLAQAGIMHTVEAI